MADERELLAEIARLAANLRERALAGGDHGLAMTARTIADHAAVGAWSLGAVMGEDGFEPTGEPGAAAEVADDDGVSERAGA